MQAMKQMQRISLALAGLTVLATGCKSDAYEDGKTPLSNAAYIDAAEVAPESRVTFKKIVTTLDRDFSVVLVSPAQADMEAAFAVDQAAVARYNRRHATDYELLPASHYEFLASKAVIEAGKSVSQPVTIRFKGLDGLDMDVTHLLPVSLTGTSAGIGLLKGSETVYYLVRRSSAITTAADLSDCYMWVPSFETEAGQAPIKGLSALTYEAIVNINEFKTEGASAMIQISSIMGVEQHCLLRIGDAGYPREQLQLQVGGTKFPAANAGPTLSAGEWYHIAFTWDIATTEASLYINGELRSKGTIPWDSETIDLGRVTTGGTEDKAYRFLIGYSYNTERMLNGMISEARVWSVARTQEEIFRDMYNVEEPESKPELRAYWKFNEGTGNVAADYSQYHNDAYCLDGKNSFENGGREEGKLKWNTSIEIPILNQ